MPNQLLRGHASPRPCRTTLHPCHSLMFLSLNLTACFFFGFYIFSSSSPLRELNLKSCSSCHLVSEDIFFFDFVSSERMSSVCDNFHHFLQSKKTLLKGIDIPPRKLFNIHEGRDFFSDSPPFSFSGDALLQNLFSCENNGGDDGEDDGEDDDLYSSDFFRMYEFKVRRCTRSRSHDWTDCPFAHPGEKARRRDPRRFHYSGNVCPEFRRGGCSRGDSCEFAHGVFECWLHPARYRTEACKDGKNCKRKVCFFAHSPRQLRILPANSPEFQTNKKKLPIPVSGQKHCCLFCHCGLSSSPTSTLLDMSHLSPPFSPPASPAKHQSVNPLTPMSRNGEAKLTGTALPEMINSLEAMSFNEANKKSSVIPPWIDVSFLSQENQQLSPSTVNSSRSVRLVNRNLCEENKIKGENEGLGCSDLDVGWVDELLM